MTIRPTITRNQFSDEFAREYAELGLIREDRRPLKHYWKTPSKLWDDEINKWDDLLGDVTID